MKSYFSLGPLALVGAISAHAQESPQVYRAPEVVVTATRFEQERPDAPIGMTVITAEDIARSTALTLPQVLAQQPGIQIRDSSGSPDRQVDMRGFGITGDQNTLVLLDGQRLSEIELTTVKWSAIPISAIERIEILRGSGAVLYGGGASGGVINIITKSPKANQTTGEAYLGAGGYSTREVRGGLNIAGENLGFTLNANHYESDNYRENNRVVQSNAEADLRYFDSERTLTLKAGSDDQDLRLPGARTEAQVATAPRGATTPFDFANRRGSHVNLEATQRLGEAELKLDVGYRERRSESSVLFFGSTFNVDTDVNVLAISPRARIAFNLGGFRHTLVAGLDWDHWDYDSERTFGPARIQGSQENRAVYAQNSTEVSDATTLTLGGRLQRTKFEARDTASSQPYAGGSKTRDPEAYEAALRHGFSPRVTAYGKLGRSFRIATVDELYNQFGGPLFDPLVSLLEPQTSNDRELGVEFKARNASYRMALYHMDLKNEIRFNPVTFANENLPPTRRYGVELDGRWTLSGSVDAFANYTFAVAEFRAGNVGGTDLSGKTVPLVPRNKANAGVVWGFAPNLRLSASVSYVGEQYYDGDETNSFGRKMPAYTLVDMKLLADYGPWSFTAGVKNLLDEKYYNYALVVGPPANFIAYPQPERALFASARYRFR